MNQQNSISDPQTGQYPGMPPRPQMQRAWKVRAPIWRRLTALFTLSFMSLVAGVLLAAALGVTALLILFVLERAIAT